jgi:hypothetical protein
MNISIQSVYSIIIFSVIHLLQAAKEELENRQRDDAKLRRPGLESGGLQHQMRSMSLGR